jgi:hypothetical protein
VHFTYQFEILLRKVEPERFLISSVWKHIERATLTQCPLNKEEQRIGGVDCGTLSDICVTSNAVVVGAGNHSCLVFEQTTPNHAHQPFILPFICAGLWLPQIINKTFACHISYKKKMERGMTGVPFILWRRNFGKLTSCLHEQQLATRPWFSRFI